MKFSNNVVNITVGSNTGKMNYFKYLIFLIKSLILSDSDVYYGHDYYSLPILYLLTRLKKNKKIIYDAHELLLDFPNKKQTRREKLSIEENIILIVYGSVSINLKESFNKNVDNFSVVYGGWLNNRDAYQAIYNSNLVIFPGRHSVYWEITAAIGKPMIVKYWKGTTHIKDKDNVFFLEDTSNKNIQKALLKVYNNQDMYIDMLKNAAEFAHHFKYSEIAKKA